MPVKKPFCVTWDARAQGEKLSIPIDGGRIMTLAKHFSI